ncbi:MAG TPA: FlgD immunoglobulin-like domain containing protein [Bacteroidota bacterium]|nr:FlgD immunoglobulin-like domain containing protein [Bacteroidota bacterium]
MVGDINPGDLVSVIVEMEEYQAREISEQHLSYAVHDVTSKGGGSPERKSMKDFAKGYFRFCPKTNRFIGVKQLSGMSRLLFPLIGLAAMVWILIRVIPKPSRLSYPCVRTAMPIASGFIGYMAMLVLSGVAFLRSKKPMRYYPVFFLGAFVVCGISGFVLFDDDFLHKAVELTSDATVNANEPMGIAKGMPGKEGRVVWVHNANAVNQNCNPSLLNHAWWAAENNNQSTIDSMVSAAIDSLTGQKTDSAAWHAIFVYHNQTRGKGAVDYAPGEKIFIKINESSGWGGNFNPSDLSKVNGNWYGMSETSPAIVLSVLHQLVDIVHVAQSDIYVGDPIRNLYKEWYTQWHARYPNIHFLGYDNYASLGREQVKPSSSAATKIHYSDRGTILRANAMYPSSVVGTDPIWYDSLYTIFEDAEYMLNIPQMKGHMRAGMTMFAKNHFGSQSRSSAGHLHLGLPCPEEMDYGDTSRLGYGLYRVQVDLMTQSLLRKKNLLFLMDALWATAYEQDKPIKWQMAPFNNTYSSSVFVSLDNIAIESVGYDFLRSEFTVARLSGLSGTEKLAFVQMRGADDYLHQAADSTNWPAGIKYDPDSTGVHIFSLGVHEHWNNATEKKYSRNLGTGTGIELVQVEFAKTTSVANQGSRTPDLFELSQNYPNPFNPSTTISYTMTERSSVDVTIYDIQGRIVKSLVSGLQSPGTQRVVWNGTDSRGNPLSSGVYIYRVRASSLESGRVFDRSAKMLLMK